MTLVHALVRGFAFAVGMAAGIDAYDRAVAWWRHR